MYMAQIVGFKANKAYKWSFRLYISRAEAQLGIARFTQRWVLKSRVLIALKSFTSNNSRPIRSKVNCQVAKSTAKEKYNATPKQWNRSASKEKDFSKTLIKIFERVF